MVECELIHTEVKCTGYSRFNRYMVECECVPFAYGIWWIPVLIDTWWNVNGTRFERFGSVTSFNRYMVECEFYKGISNLSFLFVLIDTWWNVNITYRMSIFADNKVLIDTWWNVNQSTSTKEFVSVAF